MRGTTFATPSNVGDKYLRDSFNQKVSNTTTKMVVSAASHDSNTVHTGGGILFTFGETAGYYGKRRRTFKRWATYVAMVVVLTWSELRRVAEAHAAEETTLNVTSGGRLETTECAKSRDMYDLKNTNAGTYLANGHRELGYLTVVREIDYANGTHGIWAEYNLTAYNEDTGRRLQTWNCFLYSRCEVIATGAISYARSCAGSTSTSNCVRWKRGTAVKTYSMFGRGTTATFTSWCQGVLDPANRIVYGELDTGNALYNDDTYSYGGQTAALFWKLTVT